MNYDEFAFFNQQLASMLRDGIPLEGALKQLSAGMSSGTLRTEVEQLGSYLSSGVPLRDALRGRALPEFYIRMLEIGARSNDLPGVLTLLADHYHRAHAIWTRLKGLMVYPLIVIFVSLVLTFMLSLVFGRFLSHFMVGFAAPPAVLMAGMWTPPILLAIAALFASLAVLLPSWRRKLRWKLPAFREASIAQIASAIALMLKNGATLSESLAMAQALEDGTPASKPLGRWRSLVETGQGKPIQWTGSTAPFPPLFLWLVQSAGEDVAAGFQKASEIYQTRAGYRVELALYGALPVAILLLGQMVFWQVAPLMRNLIWFMNTLGDFGDVLK
jgi:type IV pilus assembly protein PilC